MKNVKYVKGINTMTGAVLLSISPIFAMEGEREIEMKDFSQRGRMYEEPDTPVPLQRNKNSLTAEGRKTPPVEKKASAYDPNLYIHYYFEMKYCPFSYL